MTGRIQVGPSPAPRPHATLPLLMLALSLATTSLPGCYRAPSRWDEVQQETRRKPAVSREAVAGSEFNKMFPRPDSEGDFDLVYTQEKSGFAQAKLVNKKKSEDVATFSIFDTVNNPEAAQDYQAAPEKLGLYPMIDIGSNGTGLLVGDRFQVQVRSKDANFTKADRQDWLKKFDLPNLANLVKYQ
jgi:hypothetical protein